MSTALRPRGLLVGMVVLFLAFAWLRVVVAAERTCIPNAALSDKVYIDPKGFFRIRPPFGWHVREYQDDPRGKVDFNSGARPPLVQLKIIGMQNPFADFQAMLADAREQVERLRSRYTSMGTDFRGSVEASTLNGLQAAKGSFEIPGKFRQVGFQIIHSDNLYGVVYGGQPDHFQECHDVAMKSAGTLEVLRRQVSGVEARQHVAASKFRVAQLYVQMGRKDWALEIIEEGLRIAPNYQPLLELRRQLQE